MRLVLFPALLALGLGSQALAQTPPVPDMTVQRGAAIVTNRVVDRSLAIPPTIKVEAGTRISVIVTRGTKF